MRDNTTSIAKAFGIILMVIGHAGCPGYMHDFIYQFHIPLFFFFSGYCFKDKYLCDFRTYAKRKITGIYFPFIKYALIFLLLHNLFFHLDIYNESYGYNGASSVLYTTRDILFRIFKITTSMSYEERLLGGYWFLKILFCTSFLGYAFYRFLKKPAIQAAGIAIIYISTILLARSESLSSFWNTVMLSLFATLFFVAGKTLAANREINEYSGKWWITLICVMTTGVLAYFRPSGFTALQGKTLYIVGACAGILMTKNISAYIQRFPRISKMMVHIGDNTLTILTWHFLCFVLISWGITKLYGLPVEAIASFPVIGEYASKGWWIAYSIVGVLVPLGLSWISKSVRTPILIFCLYIAAVAYLCFAKPDGMPELPTEWFGLPADKVAHFLMFLPFPLLAYTTFEMHGMTPGRKIMLLAAILCAGAGVALGTEYIQANLEYRSSDMKDFAADAIGLAAGSLGAVLYIYLKKDK